MKNGPHQLQNIQQLPLMSDHTPHLQLEPSSSGKVLNPAMGLAHKLTGGGSAIGLGCHATRRHALEKGGRRGGQ